MEMGTFFITSLWTCVISMFGCVLFHHLANAFYMIHNKAAHDFNAISMALLGISAISCCVSICILVAA